jgi:hypothetical protein
MLILEKVVFYWGSGVIIYVPIGLITDRKGLLFWNDE